MRQPGLSLARLIGTDELASFAVERASNVAASASDGSRDEQTFAEGHGSDRDVVAVVRSRSVAESASASASASALVTTGD